MIEWVMERTPVTLCYHKRCLRQINCDGVNLRLITMELDWSLVYDGFLGRVLVEGSDVLFSTKNTTKPIFTFMLTQQCQHIQPSLLSNDKSSLIISSSHRKLHFSHIIFQQEESLSFSSLSYHTLLRYEIYKVLLSWFSFICLFNGLLFSLSTRPNHRNHSKICALSVCNLLCDVMFWYFIPKST